jgi:penicillin amidase
MKKLRRILLVIAVILALVLGALTGYGVYTTRRMLPQITGKLVLPGLKGEVQVIRGEFGVPQIFANSPEDLFFAQGVVHAQDRWWQMEFNRHTALGRITELTGSDSTLDIDIFLRTLGWHRSAQADLDALTAEEAAPLDYYAAGVNAYIAGKSGPDLAVEYSILALTGINIPIEQWQPLHSVAWANAMAWNLGENWETELEIASLYRKFGENADEMLKTYMPNYPFADNAPIIRDDELPIEAQPVAMHQPLIAPGTDFSNVSTALVGSLTRGKLDEVALLTHDDGIGSNNWVIGGGRTASGKPLLANDPHLGIQMPSIWYQVGLHCNQVSAACPYDVVGFSFPGVPGVVIGHNARIAWGVTNVGPDTQDFYIIKVDPNDDTKYELDGQTVDMQIFNETIKIGGSDETREVRVRVTQWGPIVTDSTVGKDEAGEDEDRPLALRWAATEQPKRLLNSIMALNRATDWESFRAAAALWDAPAQNLVYADVDGNIGYQTPGLNPIRANGHSGLTPVDGSTTQYDWKGYIPFENLPYLYNPPRGYISTANQAVVPMEYYTQLAETLGDQFGADSSYALAYQWAYGYRGERINDMIEAIPKHTAETISVIQGDNYNSAAALLLPVALPIITGTPNVPPEVSGWLGVWTEFQNHMNEGQPALFEAFWAEVCKRTWGDQLGYDPSGSNLITAMKALLDDPDNVWWDDITTTDKIETRDDILKEAYSAAYKTLAQQLGTDFKKWRWGDLHTATFVSNPLGQSGIDPIESFVNAGPVAASGGREIVNATSNSWVGSTPFIVRSIPSMRMIVDLGDFDQSIWIHSTGQSGHPMSSHYRDLIDKWRLIQFTPMLYTQDAIVRNGGNALTLSPN